MKRLILLFLHFSVIVSSQISFDFETTSLETWTQSRDSAWIVTQNGVLSGRSSLRHNLDDSISGEDRISFAYDSLVPYKSKTSWQFRLKHSYLPSSSNKWAVFLLCDSGQEQMRPGGRANAIILGVNFKGSDDFLCLWRMNNSGTEVLVLTSLNWQQEIGTGSTYLKVERNDEGIWSIFRLVPPVKLGNSVDSQISGMAPVGDIEEENWTLIGLGQDTLSIPAEHFGIYYKFSSRQDRKLWVDDISVQGSFVRDNVPPEIAELKVLNENSLRITFTEAISSESAINKARYNISETAIQPDSVWVITDNMVELVFKEAFKSGETYTLRIEGIADRRGNVSGLMEKGFTWFRATRGDITITEIMYDPVPAIGLPEYEFLELYNNSGYSVDIGGWAICTRSKSITLPEYVFVPGVFLLIGYKESEQKYPESEAVLEALTSRTVFSNEGAFIYLLDQDSLLIDWVEYSPGVHENEYYASGGWSLEKIDITRACHGQDNWTSSKDKNGGTPGRENSVNRSNPDLESPEILSVYVTGPTSLVVDFNEPMNIQSLTGRNTDLEDPGGPYYISEFEEKGVEAWRIENGPGTPDSILVNYPFNSEVRLIYGKEFEAGKDYYLELDKTIQDCSGNSIALGSRYRFAIPIQPGRSKILLSEILFNPLPFCPDFIEIYNPGSSTFDLADLALARRDIEYGSISSATRVIPGHRLFFPEEYLVFTEDAEALCGCYTIYDQDAIIDVKDLPSMGDDLGSVIVLDKFLEVIDEFVYDRHMHHPGLPSGEGVSLERISFLSPTQNRSNWHSASSNEGYGTPGRQNSQHGEINISEEGFELDPEIFTPNLDGVNDKLYIKYHFNSPGLTSRILIFDPRGRLIKDITGTQLLGIEGFFIWDGTNRNGEIARAGIYLVYAEVYGSTSGNRKFRLTCVLSPGL